MPIDGFTLSFLKTEIASRILPSRIDKIMQPARDTLIFNLRSEKGFFSLLLCSNPGFARLQLTEHRFENPAMAPAFCMLLRKHLQGGRIIDISQVSCDRIINIDIECFTDLGDKVTKRIVIEIMGKHSNIIFIDQDGIIIEAAKRVGIDISRVRQLLPGLKYHLPPMQDKLDPFNMSEYMLIERLNNAEGRVKRFLQDNISGLGSASAEQIAHFVGANGDDQLSDVDKSSLPNAIIKAFKSLEYAPNIVYDDMHNAIDFFPIKYDAYNAENIVYFDTLSKAMDLFYTNRDVRDKIKQKSSYLYKIITKHINRCENRLEIINSTEEQWEKAQDYKLYGEIINANLYAINQSEKGRTSISLPNFYDENYQNIDIPLNVELSIKDNANLYFKRYRKAKTAQELADSQRKETKEELAYLQQILMDMQNAKSDAELDDIKLLLAQNGYIKSERKLSKAQGKSKEIRLEHSGVQIQVGKNSIQNDRITGAAKPNDTWLHVQGAPGSHVIIKDAEPSEELLLYAAKLAAYFSTSREQTTITVDYTQKKHVKKPAQSPAGFVRYKNFKSLIINLSDEERAKFAEIS